MQFLKFNILLLSLTSTFAFTGTDCFKASFDVSVTHKAAPFGLLTKTISISKNECEIEVRHNEYKYLNKSWIIDICRDPIHVKDTSTSMDVYRKEGECHATSNDFCNEYKTIRKIIEDDGLIFAQGAKNNLDVDHGKIFCASTLIESYLNDNNVFNRNGDYDYIMIRKPIARIPEDLKKKRAEFKAIKATKSNEEKTEEKESTSVETNSNELKIDENAGPGQF